MLLWKAIIHCSDFLGCLLLYDILSDAAEISGGLGRKTELITVWWRLFSDVLHCVELLSWEASFHWVVVFLCPDNGAMSITRIRWSEELQLSSIMVIDPPDTHHIPCTSQLFRLSRFYIFNNLILDCVHPPIVWLENKVFWATCFV